MKQQQRWISLTIFLFDDFTYDILDNRLAFNARKVHIQRWPLTEPEIKFNSDQEMVIGLATVDKNRLVTKYCRSRKVEILWELG